jgi:DNA-binding CsgD family transcriptional regulator
MSTEDDPKKPREDDAVPQMAFLKDKFGLKPAEARLVLRLVAGDSLGLSAAALGIGYETARTTLKSVFRKTRTRRQAELVILIIHAMTEPDAGR